MSRILAVDDEQGVLAALRRLLARDGHTVETFTDPHAALARAEEAEVDLVISDYRMPAMDGVSFLVAFRDRRPDAVRMILSAYADLDALIAAVNEAEIHRFVAKPWNDAELRMVVRQALEHRELVLENRRLAEQVRRQRLLIARHEAALERLARAHPELARVRRDDDGAIVLEEPGEA